jgi:hypothetical protein
MPRSDREPSWPHLFYPDPKRRKKGISFMSVAEALSLDHEDIVFGKSAGLR